MRTTRVRWGNVVVAAIVLALVLSIAWLSADDGGTPKLPPPVIALPTPAPRLAGEQPRSGAARGRERGAGQRRPDPEAPRTRRGRSREPRPQPRRRRGGGRRRPAQRQDPPAAPPGPGAVAPSAIPHAPPTPEFALE